MRWWDKVRSEWLRGAAVGLVFSVVPASLPAQSSPSPAAGLGTDVAQQEQALRLAVRRTPSEAKALAALGTILARQNKLDESIPWLEKALQLNPRDADTRRTLAAAYWQLGQMEKARTHLELVLRAQPNNGWATLLLGMVSHDLGDHARAARLLHSMLPRVRQRPETILALARAYYHVNESDKARQTLGYLAALPDSSKAVLDGGHAEVQFDDYASAEARCRSLH